MHRTDPLSGPGGGASGVATVPVRDLAVHTALVTADDRMIVICDRGSDASLRVVDQRRGADGDGYRVVLRTAQDSAPVRVDLVVWDGRPADLGPDEWDGEQRLTLLSPGADLLVTGAEARLPGRWTLPAAGTYDVLVRWRRGEEARAQADDARRRRASQGWSLERARRARGRLAGIEEYRLDAWLSDPA